MLANRSVATYGPAKVDNPLHFFEPECPMRRMSGDVLDWRIGREFAATFGRGPADNFRNERTCDALAPCRGLDEYVVSVGAADARSQRRQADGA